MFLEDELEYTRLKRNENIMGWLAIVFVAALVFMFAGIMNSASATDTSSLSARHAEAAMANSQPAIVSHVQISQRLDKPVVLAMDGTKANQKTVIAPGNSRDVETPAVTASGDDAVVTGSLSPTLADHDIKTGALLVSFSLIGGSFVMLTFGGPRGGRREDEDMIDAL
ncbi:MAG TPA: hypothetical protein VN112_22070 [Ensifer sp.]|nr:hypothetical protein [Ensifer sp.]